MNLNIERVEATEEQRQHPDILQNEYSLYRGASLDHLAGEMYVARAREAPTEVRDLGFADSLVFDKKHVWPRCFLKEALRLGVAQSAPELETRHHAYVTGSGVLMRVGVLVAVQLGFQNICVVSSEISQAQKALSFLSTRTFGVQFHWLKDSELTLQPNNGSLMINTLVPSSEDPLLQDLPYLNYLQRQGLVVEMSTGENDSALMEEAQNVGVKRLAFERIQGLKDYQFLKATGLYLDSSEAYQEAWLKSISTERENKT